MGKDEQLKQFFINFIVVDIVVIIMNSNNNNNNNNNISPKHAPCIQQALLHNHFALFAIQY